MEDNTNIESIKGDRSMTQGFVAQYASEAALQINGVLSLVPSFAVALKEKAGVVHEGKGVRVGQIPHPMRAKVNMKSGKR